MSPEAVSMVHPFEKAGLGRAPFTYRFMVELPSPSLATDNPAAYMNAMANIPAGLGCGTCQFCGMAIQRNFIVESADGKRSAVGSDCVGKTCGPKLVAAVKREIAQVARVKRHTKEAAIRAERQAAWREKNAARIEQEAAERAGRREEVMAEWGFALPVLDLQFGPFCADMAVNIRDGRAPSARAGDIIRDIVAKAERKANKKVRA